MDPTITISSTEAKKIIETEKTYSTTDKKIIASRIEKITNKKILSKIFHIVLTNNGQFVESSNGITLNLTSMKNKIISLIERILDLYDEAISKKQSTEEDKWSLRLQNTFNSDVTDEPAISDSKLSGQEKMFLKRTQQIQNENVVYWNN